MGWASVFVRTIGEQPAARDRIDGDLDEVIFGTAGPRAKIE
jgi:hypothetical protein